MRRAEFGGQYGLERHGIHNVGGVHWNLATPALYEQAIRRGEGILAHLGPLVVRTGHHTARSGEDNFIVEEPSSRDRIWWGQFNRPFAGERFDALYQRVLAYLQGKDVFVQDCFLGADPHYRLPVRVITETAWHSLFARNLFIQPDRSALASYEPQFTVVDVPFFSAVPQFDGTQSGAFILVNLGRRMVLIGGTAYAGEIKKSIFAVLSYLLPQESVLAMHCSANVGPAGDVALFFGLTGSGKTTLATDASRRLIGDDEHGWSDEGVFNFEGGCYAKVMRLSRDAEPLIYETTRRFGTVLENVATDVVTRRVDLDNAALTANTRAAYPLSHIPNSLRPSVSGHPRNLLFLAADPYGVLPPIARLDGPQAIYHYLTGYSSAVAERHLEEAGYEPEPVFRPCFGAQFMALHPSVYVRLLGERIAKHEVRCWLVNTGWAGGQLGVGDRIDLAHTRAMIGAALGGLLDAAPMWTEPVFGVQVPQHCPGVPAELLDPRSYWPNAEEYDRLRLSLARRFVANFRQFEDAVPEEVRAAGPRVG